MDELAFSGKTVLVVGGSSGIGNGIAPIHKPHLMQALGTLGQAG